MNRLHDPKFPWTMRKNRDFSDHGASDFPTREANFPTLKNLNSGQVYHMFINVQIPIACRLIAFILFKVNHGMIFFQQLSILLKN